MPKWNDKHSELGATTSCSLRATSQVANCGQKAVDHRRNLIQGDSWFSSFKTAKPYMKVGMSGLALSRNPTAFFLSSNLKVH
jgi:hypothetical protein